MFTRFRSDRGSALMLVPAAVVITVILASFTLNSALTFLAEQELERTASAAANDAVSAIGQGTFYEAGGYVVDSEFGNAMTLRAVAPRTTDSVRDVVVELALLDEVTVAVTATGHPRIASWRILPWVHHAISVTVQASGAQR